MKQTMPDSSAYFREAFSRNLGILSRSEQERLRSVRVAIPGMGGLGGTVLATLTRTGVGAFNLADFDRYETANMNRQFGASSNTIGQSKLEVMTNLALELNPHLKIQQFPKGVEADTIDSFLSEVDVLVDGFDFFAIEIRRKTFARARELGIPVITAGPIGFGVSMLVFLPDQGMSCEEYFDFADSRTEEERYCDFLVGLNPTLEHRHYIDPRYIDLSARRGPSLGLTCQLCSSMAATEVLRVLLKRGDIRPAPWYTRFDPYRRTYHVKKLPWGNRHPLQRLKRAKLRSMLKQQVSQRPAVPELPAEPADATGRLSNEAVRYIVAAGINAPSGDNTQHWRFTWNGEALKLFGDRSRSDFFCSTRGESEYIAFGAVLENIRIAASELGYQAESKHTLGDPFGEIATVTFRPDSSPADPLAAAVFDRATVRGPYSRTPLEQHDIDTLNGVSDDLKLTWFLQAKERSDLTKRLVQSDRIIWEDSRFRDDLTQWIRYGKSAKTTFDGLTPATAAMKPYEEPLAPIICNPRSASMLNYVGLSRKLSSLAKRWANESGGLCLISTNLEDTPEGNLQAGSALERFWLQAELLGLRLQPMTALVVHFYHVQAYGIEHYQPKHRDIVQGNCEWLQQQASASGAARPFFVFRLGYGPRAAVRAPRRPLDDVLTIE